MSVVVQSQVRLVPGSRLSYDCPSSGGSWRSEQFFDQYRGKLATFVAYTEKIVGLLDNHGIQPGRYLDPGSIVVRFDGEEEVHELQPSHFRVVSQVEVLAERKDPERLGGLPHEPLFYPGDTVRFTKNPEGEVRNLLGSTRLVAGVLLSEHFTSDNIPRYRVLETEAERDLRLEEFDAENAKLPSERRQWRHHAVEQKIWGAAGGDLELAGRGNVWALYRDPSKLMFANDEEELSFWCSWGISRPSSGPSELTSAALVERLVRNLDCHDLPSQYERYVAGECDLIQRERFSPREEYEAWRLLDCWEQHRERVRALTERLWAQKVAEAKAEVAA